MAKTVRFSDDAFLEDVLAISLRHKQTLADQIKHFAQIGRAIERSGDFDFSKITRVLNGELETTALSGVEKLVWIEQFVARMSEPGLEDEAFFSKLCQS